MKAPLNLVVVLTAGGAAIAQTPPPTNGRLIFEFDRTTVSPQNPSVTLTVSAAWDQAMHGDHGLGAVNYDLLASSGLFTRAALILGHNPPNNAGVVNGSRINGAAIGQVVIIHSILRLDNPIMLAEYAWETTDFTPRAVSFQSEETRNFSVVPTFPNGSPRGLSIQLYPEHFTPGFGTITVVPAPAGALLLLALTPWRRRRRARG